MSLYYCGDERPQECPGWAIRISNRELLFLYQQASLRKLGLLSQATSENRPAYSTQAANDNPTSQENEYELGRSQSSIDRAIYRDMSL